MAVGIGAVGPGISGTSSGGGGGSGTVTSVSVVTAHGFSGSVANATTTPAITLNATPNGILKSNGTTVSAATSGTDYAPGTSGAATGLVVSTTGTGALTTVTAPAGAVVGTTDTQTLSNKRNVPRVLNLSAPATNPAINTDNYDAINITGLANALNITTALTGTPNPYDTLKFGIVDNGTAQTLSWTSNFEAATELPLASLGNTAQQLDIMFWYNPNTSKWRCIGVTPGPIVLVTDIASTFAVPTSIGTVFATALTLTPGTWDVEFFGIFADTTGATAGQSASFGLVQSNTGGSATFTTKNGGTGNPKGVRVTTTVAQATEITRAQVVLKETLIVTVAGTMNVNAIAGAADLTLAATDTSLGYTTTLTYLRATLIG